MNSAQLNAIRKIKAAIKDAEKLGIFIEFNPEIGNLNAGAVKENIEDYKCLGYIGEVDYATDEYEECTYDDIFETVKLCNCSQKDDDDDVKYYAKYTND